MKRGFVIASFCVCLASVAFGQAKKETTTSKETTTVTTTTKTVATTPSGYDLTSGLWSVNDATVLGKGQLDLRISGTWIPEPPQDGEQDDFAITPMLIWGVWDNVEMWVNVPIWVGDNGDRGAYSDGNYDTNFGVQWKFLEQQGTWIPSMAVAGSTRIPTGQGSDKMDAEIRLIATNEYDSCIRSHVNLWLASINGTNNQTSQSFIDAGNDDTFADRQPGDFTGYSRDLQWGLGVGLDGPIGDNLRWVLDTVYRSSESVGESNIWEADGGIEWRLAENHLLGFGARASLDHGNSTDIPDYGFRMTYAITLVK